MFQTDVSHVIYLIISITHFANYRMNTHAWLLQITKPNAQHACILKILIRFTVEHSDQVQTNILV